MANFDLSLPRRRLTQEHNPPPRINLLSNSQKRKIQEKNANPTRGINYDPLDFMETTFEMPPARRRTIQLKDMTQSTNIEQEPVRRRPIVNDYVEPMNDYSWDDKERRLEARLRQAEERAELYKSQLQTITEHYDKLKHIRTTEAENALQEHYEWSQVKDTAYLELRDKIEEELLQKKTPETSNMNQASLKYYEENNLLKTTIARLEKQLKEKEAQLNKRTPNDPRSVISLFEDLTGLIVSGCKSTDEKNEYRCIMTGKNGSFEFELAITKDGSETVFYKPTIESDSKLNTVLPEFLKEDVDFDREHLQVFFKRMVTVITEEKAEQ